jgi:Cu+-exporting ATPase
MSEILKRKTELIRLAAMAIAVLLSWLEVWKLFAGFDFIALAATLIGGYPMYDEAFQAIRKRRMTMELSMAIAVLATLLIGQFFTGLIITFFVLFAELLEHITASKGRRVVGNLIESLPRQATVRRNGKEQELDISQLKTNDIVIIKPGKKIPVDGMVIKGGSFVDQSSISGEPLPVEKMAGHRVFAGTMNQSGVLEVRTQYVGMETTFGKIVHIIEEAEKSKAPIQKVADKLAGRLVYFALAGAAATYLYTRDIESTIAALIVAGACGVAAGTPLAVLAGIGRTAREGIIVKGGVYLEQLAGIDTVVVDKTGTMTLGVPQVVHVQSFDGKNCREVLQAAASIEQHSEHPLAGAILKKAKDENVEPIPYSNIEYLPGKGLYGSVNGEEILVGNASLLEEKKINPGSSVSSYVSEKKERGETSVFVLRNRETIGAITVADTLRDDAKQAVAELKELGMRVVLLTGDSVNAAKTVGKTLQVDEVFGEMLPHQKVERIQELVKAGKKVAMVGDGINDAPALVEATVGIAMGKGTDIALESADMALMTDNLERIPGAIRISRRCLSVIMFNFWGTIIVDTIGIGLAFFGFLTPLLGALIHVGSELGFITNSVRLFRG